jgi:hypothetical protein
MTPEKIRQQAAALAEIYAAVANGKTLQAKSTHGWRDVSGEHGPGMSSSLHCYRIKPEPRRKWEIGGDCYSTTWSADEAADWKSRGYAVTEWQEVVS